MAQRHDDFLAAGARLFAVTADSPAQNSFVMEELALPFPLLSDPERTRAITPLGFADESDPRLIARTGSVVVDPDGETVWRYLGRDYADRPHEDELLEELTKLGLERTTQDQPELGEPVRGPSSTSTRALPTYLRGAKFAALALRRRHHGLSDEFKADTKSYVQMTERYIEAISTAIERRA